MIPAAADEILNAYINCFITVYSINAATENLPAELGSLLSNIREKGDEQSRLKEKTREKSRQLLGFMNSDGDEAVEEAACFRNIQDCFENAIRLSELQIHSSMGAITMEGLN